MYRVRGCESRNRIEFSQFILYFVVMGPAFTILEHPADLGIEAQGLSLAEAFQNAAAGLMSIIMDLSTVELLEMKEIAITGSDREQLLVKWLSEVLYLYDGQHFACGEFIVHHLGPTTLTARVRGEGVNVAKHRMRQDVKAVTYHQLLAREDNQGGLVRVFLDI